ncbi:tyrosine recombinase XerS [Oxobacter pfennigii]|uniref:Tyrosine recombinase XerS n=1 Tax=Oxobacter pfennigii TaxID=36849 RepID=A0A0P8WVB9_9CLOT|nr:site-specific integrase [Oxobacter pfennigii]KPU42198.1 tyrosine recombinase XerS [Oxobacter pfennigii]
MSIRKIEEGYYVEVYLGKDPLTGKKKRKTKTCKTSKEAKAFEAKWLTMSANGEIEYGSKMTLSDYLDYWYKSYVLVQCAYQTQTRYTTFCNCIKNHIGHIKIDKLAPPIIQQFYNNLLGETKKLKNGTVINRYAQGTVLKTHKMLHLALKWAVIWQMIRINPTDNVSPPSDDKREIEVWSLNEIKIFMDFIKDNAKFFNAVTLAYSTGMREAEISALKWDAVDFNSQIIKVKHSMVEKKGGVLVPETPKTKNSKRNIPIDTVTMEWLNKLKAAQEDASKVNHIDYEYVCCWEDGRPLRPQYITKTFSKCVQSCSDKVKTITFHGLRHTHASLLYDIKETSNVISKRLGHARTSVTDDIYIHIKKDAERAAADKLGQIFKIGQI